MAKNKLKLTPLPQNKRALILTHEEVELIENALNLIYSTATIIKDVNAYFNTKLVMEVDETKKYRDLFEKIKDGDLDV